MGFPFSLTSSKVNYRDIFEKEGMPWNNSFTYTGVSPSGLTLVGNYTENFGINYVICGLEGEVECDTTVKMNMSVDGDPSSVYVSKSLSRYLMAGHPEKVKTLTPLSANAAGIYLISGDGTTQIKCSGMFSGYKMTNDLNFNADKKIYWLGDSIAAPTIDTNVTQFQIYSWIVRDWLIANSVKKRSARLVLKAIPGRSSKDYDLLLGTNRLFIDSPDYIFYQHGMNDSAQSIGTTAYKADMNNVIKFKQLHWPKAKLIMLGTTPCQSTTAEATLATYRTAMAQVLFSVASDPNIVGIDLARSFDRTATGMYAASDGSSGTSIHPGTALSHAGIATKITTGYDYDGITRTNFAASGVTLPSGGLADFGISLDN